jgi:hypothetical protein
MGRPEGQRPLGRPRSTMGDTINYGSSRNLTGEDVDVICVARIRDRWRALVNTAMNIRVLQNAENFLTG